MEGFPSSVRGRVLFSDKDNLNTDGIYAGKHTYRDDMTPEQMAAVTFENYDPKFNELYQAGDVVVAGFNFGTGSSREQAATALKFKGIPCVIAGSFSETYKRNAFNNGFVVFECPELVTHLRTTLSNRQPTTGGPEIPIDYASSVLTVHANSFPFPPPRPAAQALSLPACPENPVAARPAPACSLPPARRFRFRPALGTADRAFRVATEGDDLSRMTVVWDLEGAEPVTGLSAA